MLPIRLKDASALLTLETLVLGKVMHSWYVCPQVAPLGELYAAEAAGVGLLSNMSRGVCVQGLLLGEGFATTATLIGVHSGVGPLVFDQSTWLSQFLAVKLTDDLKFHVKFLFRLQVAPQLLQRNLLLCSWALRCLLKLPTLIPLLQPGQFAFSA